MKGGICFDRLHKQLIHRDRTSFRHIAFDTFARGQGQSDLWLVHGLVLMLMLPVFSIAYTCAYACTLVKTRLKFANICKGKFAIRKMRRVSMTSDCGHNRQSFFLG